MKIRAEVVSELIRCFKSCQHGNVAVLFAVALVPILSFIGAAIDYSRANKSLTAMQAAADSAVLMVSKDLSQGLITADQISTKASSYFNALLTSKDLTGVSISATYTPKDSAGNSQVELSSSGSISTVFMRVAGYPNLALSSASTAKWGGTRMRVAIALDVTASMGSAGKLEAMKTAAKSLIDTLGGLAKTADDIYASIIPFAEMVNVGTTNSSTTWLDWTGWDEVNGSCSKNSLKTKATCVAAGKTWTAESHSNWKGCVTDRTQPYDTTLTAPTSTSTNYPASKYVYVYDGTTYDICPAQILPMTSLYTSSNVTVVKDKVTSLALSGSTNQPIGMVWAWASLQIAAPLNAPSKDSNYDYTDVIILLSDGLNTKDRWYGDGVSHSMSVDDRQKLLCDNVKTKVNGKAPAIYTIQVNTDADPESAVLKYCADSGKFYSTTSASGMAGIFGSIGTSLAKLRVAK